VASRGSAGGRCLPSFCMPRAALPAHDGPSRHVFSGRHIAGCTLRLASPSPLELDSYKATFNTVVLAADGQHGLGDMDLAALCWPCPLPSRPFALKPSSVAFVASP